MLEEARAKATVTRQLVSGCIFTSVVGSIVALIVAAIMRREPADAPPVLPATSG